MPVHRRQVERPPPVSSLIIHVRPLRHQPPYHHHIVMSGRNAQLLLHGTTPTLASSPSARNPTSPSHVSALPAVRGGRCSEGGFHGTDANNPPPPTPLPHLHPFRETVKGWVSFHPTRPGGQTQGRMPLCGRITPTYSHPAASPTPQGSIAICRVSSPRTHGGPRAAFSGHV